MRASEFGDRLKALCRRVETLQQAGDVDSGRSSAGLREVQEELATLAAAYEAVQREIAAAQARAEEARLLEVIQENVQSGIALLDLELRHVRVNTMYEQALQLPDDQLIGRGLFELHRDEHLQAVFKQVRDTGHAMRCDELPVPIRGRGLTYWNGALAPVKDDHGRVYGLVLSLIEVTEQVRTRERLLAAERARAELAQRVTAEINHRMKNNLAMIAGVLQLQLRRCPPRSRVADELQDAITRLGALSVIHEQLYDEEPGRVELVSALRRVGELAVHALAPEGAELSVEGKPVHVSPRAASELAVVANELVTNAIKYGAPAADGKRHLAICLDVQGARLRLGVWNSGNPIAEGFDPQAQGGLGLCLLSDFAVQHDGSLNLRPACGGTVAEVVAETGLLA